jgi:hypothetical protein
MMGKWVCFEKKKRQLTDAAFEKSHTILPTPSVIITFLNTLVVSEASKKSEYPH